MNQKFTKGVGLSVALLLGAHAGFAQLSGTKTIPGTYASISAAISDLNTQGVGPGGVTFNVAAGYTETLTGPLSITATGTVANPIIIQKSGAGLNPVITAHTTGTATNISATPDGMVALVGSDYITIDGIDLRENVANTGNALMEYGYGLFKASATDGCQNNTIKNCVITLNKANIANGAGPMLDGSIGITVANSLPTAATTALTITTASGSNSFNKFYSNTIQNTNIGIGLAGYVDASPFTNGDKSNDIGGTAVGTGNTILNFGGGASGTVTTDSLVSGILAQGQYNLNASFNTINSNNGSGVANNNTIRGIYLRSGDGTAININNNTISLNRQIAVAVAAGQRLVGIENVSGGANATVNINNNMITGCRDTTLNTTTSSNNFFYGIYNTAAAGTLNINTNTFTGNSTGLSSGSIFMIYNAAAVANAINMNGNTVSNLNFLTTTAGGGTTNAMTLVGIIYNNAAGANAAVSLNNNNISGLNFSLPLNGILQLILNKAAGATTSNSISGNTITNIICPKTGGQTTSAISYTSSTTATNNNIAIQNNVINGVSLTYPVGSTLTSSLAGIICTYNGVSSLDQNNYLINNNTIYNLNSQGGTGAVTGINFGGPTSGSLMQLQISGNTIDSITSTYNLATTLTNVYGLNITGGAAGSSIFNNKIRNVNVANLNASTNLLGIAFVSGSIGFNVYANTIDSLTSANGIVTAINQTFSSGNMSYFKNKIYNLTGNGAGSVVTGINTTGGVAIAPFDNIKIYNNVIGNFAAPIATSATSDVIRGIALSATGTNAPLVNNIVSYNTIYLNAAAGGASFNTSGIYHVGNTLSTSNNLILRNNVIVNTSVVGTSGTLPGVATAIKRNAVLLPLNFDLTSDNNLLFGTSGLYAEGYATFPVVLGNNNVYSNYLSYLLAFPSQALHSVSQNVNFIATLGASVDFLRPNATIATSIESGGINISGITDDINGVVRNTLTPDLGAYEGNYNQIDTTSPIVNFTPLAIQTSNTSNPSLTAFATIYDQNGVNITAGTKPRLYYKKGTDNNAFVGNTSADNGWKYVEASNATSPFNFTIDYSKLQTTATVGDSIQYFVVAQDLAGTPNAGPNNGILFAAKPTSVSLSANTVSGNINYYKITPGIGGTVTVGTGAGQTYNSLSSVGGLFEAIQNGTVTGDITAVVSSNTIETGVDSLKQWIEDGVGGYKINIVPDGTTERILKGSNTSMIVLSGVKKVAFNGGATKSLRFTNTSVAAAASTFTFLNDCMKDTLQNCYVEGAAAATAANFGGNIVLATTNVLNGLGNDSIAILNNVIKDTLGTVTNNVGPAILLKSNGTTGSENDGIIVSGNEFMNWTLDGIGQGTSGFGGSNWKIMNNAFYQTLAKNTNLYAIHLYGSAGSGDSIVNNSIGGSAADRSGAPLTTSVSSTGNGFTGISVLTSAAPTVATVIQNNTISNITLSGTASGVTFTGIGLTSGTGTIIGNKIANITLSAATSGNIFYGINSSYNALISGNTIGGSGTDRISTAGSNAYGIYANAGAALTRSSNVRNNTIRNIVSSFANTGTTAPNSVAGIYSSGGLFTYDNNVIDSIMGNSTVNLGGTSPTGIMVVGSLGGTTNVVSNNTISNVMNTNTATTGSYIGVAGIQVLTSASSSSTKVTGNKISNIYGFNTATGTTASNNVIGIHDNGTGANEQDTFANNMITLGTNVTPQSWLRGMGVSGSTPSGYVFLNNTVVLTGAYNSTENAYRGGTACFFKLGGASPVTLRNNLFYNLSSNTGTASTTAITNNGALTGWNSDYNLVFTANPAQTIRWTPTTLSYSLADFKALNTGFELNSISDSVAFAGANDCHIDVTSPKAWNVYGRGIALPTLSLDVDSALRSLVLGIPTTIGADEIAVPSATPADMVIIPATPTVGQSTVFMSAGRKIAEITWTTAVVPTSLSAKYYPGVPAPGATSSPNINSYFEITASPDNGIPYTINSYYTQAEGNGILDNLMSGIKAHTPGNYVSTGGAGTSTLDINGRYVTSNTLTDFSTYSLTGGTIPLALEIVDIAARNVNTQNRIDWSTAKENMSDKFELERSIDGKSFNTLATINAKGQPSAYTYYDAKPVQGINYYRLKLVSENGASIYTKVVNATVKSTTTFAVNAYPNPVQNKVSLQITGTIEANATVQVTDVTGKLIQTLKVTGNQMDIEMNSLSTGIYFIKYTDDLQSQTLKINKQ